MESIIEQAERVAGLAIRATLAGAGHVFCEYAAHTNTLDVRGYPINTRYLFNKNRLDLFAPAHIKLSAPGAPAELRRVERELNHLITTAQEATA